MLHGATEQLAPMLCKLSTIRAKVIGMVSRSQVGVSSWHILLLVSFEDVYFAAYQLGAKVCVAAAVNTAVLMLCTDLSD